MIPGRSLRPWLRPWAEWIDGGRQWLLRRLDLTAKLLAMMLVLSLLSLLSIYVIWVYSERALMNEVVDNIKELSTAIQISVEQLTSRERTDEARLRDYVARLKKRGVKEVSIVSNEQEVIASSNPRRVGARINPRQRDLLITARFGEEGGTPELRRVYNLLVPIVVGAQQHGYAHIILVLDDYDRLLRLNNLTRLAATLAIFTFGMFASLFLARRYTRPIYQVIQAAKAVASGRLTEMAVPSTGGEITELVLSFNEMVARLRQNKALEERLRQAEQFSALGQLAAGIAHEIRNPLNMISLGIDHVSSKLAPVARHPVLPERTGAPGADAEALHGLMLTMKQEIHRLNELVEQFLQHGKPLRVTLTEQPIAPLLVEVIQLAEQKARAQGIKCEARLPADLPPVRVDATQIKTCFMNVVLNAIQAMPAGGRLTIEAAIHPTAARWLDVRVQDTGPGIPPELLPRVCEPYFTTKTLGIGLGLALTKRIIEEHGGRLLIESEPGQGTMVRLRLPVLEPRRPGTP